MKEVNLIEMTCYGNGKEAHQLWDGGKPQFIIFANFSGVNTPITAVIKLSLVEQWVCKIPNYLIISYHENKRSAPPAQPFLRHPVRKTVYEAVGKDNTSLH